jgi:hypothetical protein
VSPREAAIGLGKVDERQALVVAQHRRNRHQQAAAFVARMNQHAHVHLLAQSVLRIFDDYPHGHSASIRIH